MEVILAQGDRVRRELLRFGVRFGGPWVAAREPRVAVIATICVLTALAGAALIPVWMVLLGPLAWGVPHVVADLRYLFVREARPRKIAIAILVGLACAGLAAGRGLPSALVACAVAFLLSHASPARRIAGAAGAL